MTFPGHAEGTTVQGHIIVIQKLNELEIEFTFTERIPWPKLYNHPKTLVKESGAASLNISCRVDFDRRHEAPSDVSTTSEGSVFGKLRRCVDGGRSYFKLMSVAPSSD